MITMLTYIEQIDIGEYKKTLLNALKQPWLPCFDFFLYPKHKR